MLSLWAKHHLFVSAVACGTCFRASGLWFKGHINWLINYIFFSSLSLSNWRAKNSNRFCLAWSLVNFFCNLTLGSLRIWCEQNIRIHIRATNLFISSIFQNGIFVVLAKWNRSWNKICWSSHVYIRYLNISEIDETKNVDHSQLQMKW